MLLQVNMNPFYRTSIHYFKQAHGYKRVYLVVQLYLQKLHEEMEFKLELVYGIVWSMLIVGGVRVLLST